MAPLLLKGGRPLLDASPGLRAALTSYSRFSPRVKRRYGCAAVAPPWLCPGSDGAYYQAAFRARLAEKLTAQGWELEFAKGDLKIAGLQPAARKFQRRTDRIEEEAQRLGLTSDKAKDGLGAKTRQKKVPELSEEQLRQAWMERLDLDDQRALGTACARLGSRVMPQEDSREVDYAARHLFERESVVSEHKLLAEALRHGIGAVTVEGVHAALEKAGLMAGEHNGQRHWTSPALWSMEQMYQRLQRQQVFRITEMGEEADGYLPKDAAVVYGFIIDEAKGGPKEPAAEAGASGA